jgi:hypothetical protein
MSQATESKLFEDVFQNIRKAAEANLKMQQEMFRQWSSLLPTQGPQGEWTEKFRNVQKQWSSTVAELARKHRDVMDRQYQAATESLEAALDLVGAANPEEYRQRSERLCRKTLDCLREVSETQLREFQEAATKWTELFTKAGT